MRAGQGVWRFKSSFKKRVLQSVLAVGLSPFEPTPPATGCALSNGENMQYHPIADIFPLLDGQPFRDLVDDIRQHGLREPIWVYEDQILDGRNRWRACCEVNAALRFKQYEGDDPVGFVVSLNLHRRHLNESQRGMVGSKLAKLKVGKPNRENSTDYSNKSAAELLNVSDYTIKSAKKVQNKGTPDLIKKVEAGTVRVSTAADIATLPENQQDIIVGLGEKAILMAAKEIRSKKAAVRREENERIRQQAMAIEPPEGQYRCIVMDPPWPMKKISRDLYPEQTPELDYPTLSLEDIKRLTVPAAEQCHLWLWTTQRFLWDARDMLVDWGFTCLAVMVWHKAGGFQPAGLPQFNCEFVIIGRRGALEFNDTKNFPLCFQAPRREHSRKPDEFYDLVSRVSPEPRIDMFSREPREGFAQFGAEPHVFS